VQELESALRQRDFDR
jgi:chromosome segregation ATPase